MTTIINLFAGSGAGKSTTAAGIFYLMKLKGLNVELVREYVKDWAYLGKIPTENDQSYLFGEQSQRESILYGKVDYIITDSPLMLSGVYEAYYSKGRRTGAADHAKEFIHMVKLSGHIYKNFWINRTKPFSQIGRYETEEQAREIDVFMKKYLEVHNIPFVEISTPDAERAQTIVDMVLKEQV